MFPSSFVEVVVKIKEQSIGDIKKLALAELCKLSLTGLQRLDDLNTSTFNHKNWPSMAKCVRIAMLIKGHKRDARKAKTKREQREHLRAIKIFKNYFNLY